MASFCKVLKRHTAKLQIPPEFVNNYGQIFRQSSKIMKLKIDDESGKVWRVVMHQIGEFQFFIKGWTKFAQEVDLEYPSFIIFKLVDKSTFHVSIYDETACRKDYSYSENDDDNSDDDEVKNGSNGETRWRFSKELKEHHFQTARVLIPKAFALGTGIATKKEIILQDGKGREWAVGVTGGGDNSVYSITRGWKRFLAENEACIGNIISFEFIGGSANLVRALVKNNGTPDDEMDEYMISIKA